MMDSTVGQFMAIRMIILKPGENPGAFKNWMTGSGEFLDKMGQTFQYKGLLRIIFLEGNKVARQSSEHAERALSTAAGANADFAWITYWTSKGANTAAWSSQERPNGWNEDWNEFRSKCYPRQLVWPNDLASARPPHGPAYDYLGASGNLYDQQTQSPVVQRGKGAGCLVEGFEVIYDKTDWP